MMQLIVPLHALHFAIHDDGTLEHLDAAWPGEFLVSEEVLARADGRRLVRGDGTLIFRCTNGGARYALSATTVPGARLARLVAAWEA